MKRLQPLRAEARNIAAAAAEAGRAAAAERKRAVTDPDFMTTPKARAEYAADRACAAPPMQYIAPPAIIWTGAMPRTAGADGDTPNPMLPCKPMNGGSA